MDKPKEATKVREGYLRTLVNYDQNDWYQLLTLAKHAYNNATTKADKMTPSFANYGFHPQMEWMRKGEAHNPGGRIYTHWMQDIHRQEKQILENTRESMKKNYDRQAREQLIIEVGHLVMLHVKNRRSKRLSKK